MVKSRRRQASFQTAGIDLDGKITMLRTDQDFSTRQGKISFRAV